MPFGPGQPRRAEPEDQKPELARGESDRDERGAAILRGAHDPAVADPRATYLELRLDERQHLAGRRQAAQNRGQHLRERYERDIHDREIRELGTRERGVHDRGLKAASVGALQHVHARIGAQRVRELAVADVDREDLRRPRAAAGSR